MTYSLQLKNGKWYGVLPYQDECGQRKTKWISTGLSERGNKKAAKEIIEKQVEEFEKKLAHSKAKIERRSKPKEIDKSLAAMPFSEYCEKYIESIKGKLSTLVYDGYKRYLKKIRAFFDKDKLRVIDISDGDIEDFHCYLKNQGLKNVSIKRITDVTRPALRQAYKDKLIPDNPYEFVTTLSRERPSLKFYDKHEMAKLFKAIEGNKYELLIKMAGYYGFRRSEVIGLRWSAIDFDHNTISINHKVVVINKKVELSDTLKTNTSRRTLPLIQAIKDMLLEKKEEIEDNKRFYGNSYNQKYLDYVFVHDDGKLIYPDVITNNFAKILKQNNLKHIRFHDLRHSCASIMLANGVPLKQIQDWLGHANFNTTADVYSHLDFSSKVQSASVIENALDMGGSSYKGDSPKGVLSLVSIRSIMNEMNELGFSDIKEYIDYVERMSNDKKQKQVNHDDTCM